MSNKINEHSIEAKVKTIWDETGNKDFPPMNRHLAYGLVIQELLAELKKCYEEIDRKNKWLAELDRCSTCGKEGVWATADADAEFDDECRRCGRDTNASL